MSVAYRLFLNKFPKKKESLRQIRENRKDLQDFPLAISHKTTKKGNRRYDYILVSQHWDVINVSYLFDKCLLYGSDNAVVVADIDQI